MSWFSILPPSFGFVEIWVARLFLLLGTITIGPWLLVLVYDGVLYLFRTTLYEFPYIGGRAKDRAQGQASYFSSGSHSERRRISLNGSNSSLFSNDQVNELNMRPSDEPSLYKSISKFESKGSALVT